MKETLLIKLYCTVCHHYRTTLAAQAQRFSNNFLPKFTDEECLTIYLFGIREGNFTVKAIYTFIKRYWRGWFPDLPAYQNFNRRINYLAPAFQLLSLLLLRDTVFDEEIHSHLLDSFPIIVAGSKRSGSAKTAKGLCQKGYCASKSMYYYGVKLHVLGQKQYKALPKPRAVLVTSAAESDITVAKEWLEETRNMDVFADKAYADATWAAQLRENRVRLYTPVKLKKGQAFLDSADSYFSQAVSRARQAIESFFNWIQQKTQIQFASKVRSENGLIAFIFARLASLAFFYS
jgi:transposase